MALIVGLAQLGLFQAKEIKTFDLLTQLTTSHQRHQINQSAENLAAARVIVVGITEDDIRAHKQWPLSDQIIARLLARLQAHSPKVIGLDIYRDFPLEPGTQALAKQLEQENVVTILKLDDLGREEVASPLKVPAQRIGFSDFVVDPDGVIRRNFMFAVSDEGNQLYSLALRLVGQFVVDQGLAITAEGDALTIGDTLIPGITSRAGGYQTIDAAGYQTLMRYFSPGDAPLQLSLTQVLSGDFDPAWIGGKVVLIGTTAPSGKDLFYTPFSAVQKDSPLSSGVSIHAEMTRQLLSAVLDRRSLISVWPQWGEFIWIGLWGLTGGLIVWRFTHPGAVAIAAIISLAGFSAITGLLFMQAVWVPFVAPIAAFGLTGAVLVVYKEFRQTFYDSITGLPNRRLITQALQKLLKRTWNETERPITAVILLDIDRFKVFNEGFGFEGGDRLLQIVANRLKQSIPTNATVARMSGNEFVVLAANLTRLEDAIALASKLSKQMSAPVTLGNQKLGSQKIFPTVSTGIAYRSALLAGAPPRTKEKAQAMNAESLLRDAQTAIFKAKDGGNRGQCEVFSVNMRAQLSNQMWIESDLRAALSRQELLLHYQPLVCLKTMTVAGFEALIRWQHPEKGLIFPGDFIAIAEDTGLIIPIGQWVLETACKQAQQWQQKFSNSALFMSVNLSGRQFAQRDLVEQVDRILTETGMERSALKLELTESIVMDKVEDSIKILLRLKGLHLKLGIDDFGTGYSSLSYLHRFPIDTLKIDRSFVMAMETPDGTAELVKTIIALGHNLNMDVVAEGIETPRQAQELRALCCEYGQGYLFSKPLAARDAEALLAKQPPNWQGHSL